MLDQVADFPRRERVEIAHGRSLVRAQCSVSAASTFGSKLKTQAIDMMPPEPPAGVEKLVRDDLALWVPIIKLRGLQPTRLTALLEPTRAWVSSLHSCEFFVFGAKIREAFLLGKVTREWRSLVLA